MPDTQRPARGPKQDDRLTPGTLLRYPVALVFFAFLAVFTAADFLSPDREYSDFERLKQAPDFTLTSFMDNEWTLNYGEYVRDQFLFRDDWVSAHSLLEGAQGKVENGGVWFAQGGYQIAKNDTWSAVQERVFPLNTEAAGILAQTYPGRVHVMIVPSPAYILRGRLPFAPSQIDEGGMTDAMLAELAAAGALVTDLRPAFEAEEARGAQLYYRTDHHWTTDGGARVAYEALCEALGKTPAPMPAALRREVPGFLGTNFMKSKRFGTQADTLVYYGLPNAMTYTEYDGAPAVSAGIMDEAKLAEFDKYSAFLHGNNGYSEIVGGGEGSILVVKDSYGNCFVPYLVQNYARVGVVDLRNWAGLSALIDREGYDEIVVLYSFASFTQDADAIRMAR